MKKNNKRAFTLIELMVTVAILAILLFFALPRYKDTTKSSQIRVFEMNSRNIMVEMNNCYIEDDGKSSLIFDKINPKAIALNGKPEYSSYIIDKNSKILTCKLKKEAFGGSQDYIIKYEPGSQKITQEPYGLNGEDLIEGATDLSTK